MKSGSSTKQHFFDYLIIGAGPAGIQLGYYLEKTNKDYLILEANDAPASFFATYPRHRTLLSINKVYTGYSDPEINLRWDWNSLLCDDPSFNFTEYAQQYFPGADDLVQYIADFVDRFNIKIRYGVKVKEIDKQGYFVIHTEDGRQFGCRRLIVATGLSRPYMPGIPGIALTENYVNVSIDSKDFINQRVLIIGKGNSAFETAENLIGTTASIHVCSPNSLLMAWQTHYPGHLRAINNNFLDTYQLKSQNAVLDADINEIRYEDDQYRVSVSYRHANGEQEDLFYDRVINCTGFRFDPALFGPSCLPGLDINNRYPAQTSEWESVNVKDLYFAGTIMHARDYKKCNSSFIHGFRYNVRALYRILERKYHQTPWPSKIIELTAEKLTEETIRRINQSSALWQQFGFLGDVITFTREEGRAAYLFELPLDYAKEQARDLGNYYQVTLEYGANHMSDNPFNESRIHRQDVDRAARSNFLHPVIRFFSAGKMVAEHHIIEDLAAEWQEEEHIRPLQDFFEHTLSPLPQQVESLILS